jgi:hypothetical protein
MTTVAAVIRPPVEAAVGEQLQIDQRIRAGPPVLGFEHHEPVEGDDGEGSGDHRRRDRPR